MQKTKKTPRLRLSKCTVKIQGILGSFYQKGKFPITEKEQLSFNELINEFNYLSASLEKDEEGEFPDKFVFNLCEILKVLGLIFLKVKDEKFALPENFWFLCYSVFNLAEKFELQNIPVKNELVEIEMKVISINILFKQILIFQQLDTKNLNQLDKTKIFSALIRVCGYIEIKSSLDIKKKKIVSKFCLEKDSPPSRLEYKAPHPLKTLRYIDLDHTLELVEFLLYETESHQDKHLEPELYTHLIKNLEQEKVKRRYTRVKSNNNCQAILGLDNVVNFLLKKEAKSLRKYHQEEQKSTENSVTENTDNSGSEMVLNWQRSERVLTRDLTIIDNSINGYAIFWQNIQETELQLGDVLGILSGSKSQHLEIGLIRRVDISNHGITFGVELISPYSTLIYLERNKKRNNSEWVVFLFGSAQHKASILTYSDRNYKVNEPVLVQLENKKAQCRLGKVINSSELITQMVLRY